MAGRALLTVFLLMAAGQAHACSMKMWRPGELVENRPARSANGRFEAVVRWFEGVIYRTDGTRLAVVTYADLLSASDAVQVALGNARIEDLALRQEPDGREVVVVTFAAPEKKTVVRRIEVATGALLDERYDIYPGPRVFLTAVGRTDSPRPYEPVPPECADALASAARLGSERFFTHAVHTPLPPFPVVAGASRKVRGGAGASLHGRAELGGLWSGGLLARRWRETSAA